MDAPANSTAALLNDPHWFPDGFDAATASLSFVRTTSADLAAQAFLDWRWKREGMERARVSVSSASALLAKRDNAPAPRFIWHTGFCCSTLLAKTLNADGRSLSLCEPQLMVDVADAKRTAALTRFPALGTLPRIALHLLTRRFEPGMVIVLKPAPAANHLLPEMALLPQARHLFLFSSCESFVMSVAKLGEQGKRYARDMLSVLARNGAQWGSLHADTLSELKLAALLWHAQIAEFHANWSLMGNRAQSLDCEILLANPEETLARLDEFFELRLGAGHVESVVRGATFSRNAKRPEEAFNAEHRRSEHDAMRRKLDSALDDAIAWARETGPAAPPLQNPLMEKVLA
ncbi:MAG: hypothetical protein WDM89_00105 [Rhizomicrobium sp.]